MVDMPFMSYTTREQALDNAVRIMQEGGAMMVKLEIGRGQVGDRRAPREPGHSALRASRA